MLTGEGLIGKIITTIASKVASRLLGIPMDKRRKVAQALTKLYFATVRLDEVTDQFIEIFDRFGKDADDSDALLIAIKTEGKAPRPIRFSERCTCYKNSDVIEFLNDPLNYRAEGFK